MDQRLLVNAITKEITGWNCKVQVVDRFRPRQSKDSFVHFQTILLQDEREKQVSIVLYGDDIPKYEKLYTIVVPITRDALEEPLPVLTKLDALSFLHIEHQHPGAEFDLLGSECDRPEVSYSTPYIEFTKSPGYLMKHACVVVIYVSAVSTSKKPFLFTIWDDLADNEGAALLHHLHEYPVILAKRISVTEFRCALRLATRYQTTILTNP
ncbi:hypothetical protein P3S68_013867 [Capsicum galapagoense]